MTTDEVRDKARRKALALGVGLGAVGLARLSRLEQASSDHETQARSDGDWAANATQQRQPVVYLPHGGGPWPFVDIGFGDPKDYSRLSQYLVSLAQLPKHPPKALLVISAHWEENLPTVMTSPSPPMLYDYYGFPPESYQIQWPAPGDPGLAERVRSLLADAGMQAGRDAQRGFDHGTFVPLKLTYPTANLPTVQLSLIRGLDPARHIELGRALQPLRDEGVFIIASGMSYHNMRGFGPQGLPDSQRFDAWLSEAATDEPAARDERLTRWERAPSARAANPREEHLLPLMVAAGAAGGDRGSVGYSSELMGVRISAYHFG
jgi:aromatic ring-opening dioxygenase catalytic subunit (LigB family)